MRLILFGPPGAGKGTQAEKIANRWNISSIATGDILREAVRNKTELGLKAKGFMDKGELVTDDVIIGIIKDRIIQDDCQNGFILDGFPRTLKQAESLDIILKEMNIKLNVVLFFNIALDVLIKRLTGRRVCSDCGAIFHVYFQPPINDGICDKCQASLFQRDDDKEEVVRKRLDIYLQQTSPLIDYYQQQNLLKTITRTTKGSVEEIFEKIVELIEK